MSKRTRIELLGARNDHNYSSTSRLRLGDEREPDEGQAEPAREALEGATGSGRMDDCTAAMVLMFLSSRPGEPKAGPEQVAGGARERSPPVALCGRPKMAPIGRPAIVLNGRERRRPAAMGPEGKG